jgi:AraC family transcriptional regulator
MKKSREADKEENADVEVVVLISRIFEKISSEEIQVYKLPGGKMAKIVHNGPYEECSQNYEKLFSWFL